MADELQGADISEDDELFAGYLKNGESYFYNKREVCILRTNHE